MVTAINARKEIIEHIGQDIESDPFILYFAEICEALTEENCYLSGLRSLENALNKKVCDRIGEIQKTTKYLLPSDYFEGRASQFKSTKGEYYPDTDKDGKEYAIYHNLLSETLSEVETANGFKEPLYLFEGLTEDSFLAVIQQGHPFKDYGASIEHGQYTHRIQLYIIMMQRQALPKWVYIYKHIGGYGGHGYFKPYSDQKYAFKSGMDGTYHNIYNRSILWNFLFDRADNTGFKRATYPGINQGVLDFRSPNDLHKYLRESTKTLFPTLSAILNKEYMKRSVSSPRHLAKLYKLDGSKTELVRDLTAEGKPGTLTKAEFQQQFRGGIKK